MSTRVQHSALLGVLSAVMALGLMAPVQAAGTTQISGSGYYDDAAGSECGTPPTGFADYPGLVLNGDLQGCLYTDSVTPKAAPSGIYLETGRELIVATLKGEDGTFTTSYRFEGRFDSNGIEVMGRCQHPLVAGSGTGTFAGATGRLDFKDDVENGVFYYRGHITLG